MGEGSVKGGLPEPHHTDPSFPYTSHVNGGVVVSWPGCHAKWPRFKSGTALWRFFI